MEAHPITTKHYYLIQHKYIYFPNALDNNTSYTPPNHLPITQHKLSQSNKEMILKYKLPDTATEYNVIKGTFKSGGFVRTSGDDWNCLWGKVLKYNEFSNLKEFQKVNHFPGCFQLGRKDNLLKNLNRMKRLYHEEYHFFPNGYLIPEEKDLFELEFERRRSSNANVFIVKPKASSCGRGIYLTDKLSKILKKECLVQEYIDKPLLIHNKKFDLRLYVAVTSYDPLRIYLFDNGLARFATYDYDMKSFKKRFVHLTNYSVNKKSKLFAKNEDEKEDGTGSKWSLKAFRQFVKEQLKVDDSKLWSLIKDVIIKTIISVEGHINGLIKSLMKKSNCFELYGFDILIDESWKPWLLEVNVSPSLSSSSPLDRRIKNDLISQLFTLAGVPIVDRQEFKNQQESFKRNRLTQPLSSSISISKRRNIIELLSMSNDVFVKTLTEEEKDIIEEMDDECLRKGSFERIFPTPNSSTKYQKYFESDRLRNLICWKYLQHQHGKN